MVSELEECAAKWVDSERNSDNEKPGRTGQGGFAVYFDEVEL